SGQGRRCVVADWTCRNHPHSTYRKCSMAKARSAANVAMSPRLLPGRAATNTRSDYRPSTASCDPRISDEVMLDRRVLPLDSGPRYDCGISSVKNVFNG